MAMTRVCDLCKASAMTKCYQFPVPSVLTDNSGLEFKAIDPSMSDLCPECVAKRPGEAIALLLKKAEG